MSARFSLTGVVMPSTCSGSLSLSSSLGAAPFTSMNFPSAFHCLIDPPSNSFSTLTISGHLGVGSLADLGLRASRNSVRSMSPSSFLSQTLKMALVVRSTSLSNFFLRLSGSTFSEACSTSGMC